MIKLKIFLENLGSISIYSKKTFNNELYFFQTRFRASIEILGEISGKTECLIINMDQTPVYLDPSSNHTINEMGKREVLIKKTTGTHQRCTFMLTITNDGWLFPPYIIVKSKRKSDLPNCFPEYCIVRNNPKGKKYYPF